MPPGTAPAAACMIGVLDLAALDDGTLSTEGLRRLTAHLARCVPCRAVFGQLARGDC